MDIYPEAIWKPLPEARTQPAIQVRGGLSHSIVGSAQAAYGLFLNSSSLESTFIIDLDGTVWQLMYANQRADANTQGNKYYASAETADKGNPNIQPWTGSQLHSLCRLWVWLARKYQIPATKIPHHGGWGFGYHSQLGAPSPWTPSRGKTCPGVVRIRQWHEIVLPGIVAGLHGQLPPSQEDDMYSDADRGRDEATAAKVSATAFLTKVLFEDLYASGRGASLKDVSSRKLLERVYRTQAAEAAADDFEDARIEGLVSALPTREELQDALRALEATPS